MPHTSEFQDQTDFMILPWVSLFPGSLLPLFIFEERYREMTRAALAGNRMFAIAHSYDDATVAPIGGLGIIRACVTNEDGTSNLVLQGVSRVEFSSVSYLPRPHAKIRVLRDNEESRNLSGLRSRILTLCESRLEGGMKSHEGFSDYLQGNISDSAFADLISSTLIPDETHRRALFETLELDARLSLLLDLLSSNIESA
ncbi:MAG: LON peptidase substrate-binding domain-containing protein [bacterium]